MVYNLTNITAANDPITVVTAVNDATGGLFGFFLMVAIGMIAYLSLRGSAGSGNALRASAGICALLSAVMWSAGWINDYVAIGTVLIAVMALFFSFISDR